MGSSFLGERLRLDFEALCFFLVATLWSTAVEELERVQLCEILRQDVWQDQFLGQCRGIPLSEIEQPVHQLSAKLLKFGLMHHGLALPWTG